MKNSHEIKEGIKQKLTRFQMQQKQETWQRVCRDNRQFSCNSFPER